MKCLGDGKFNRKATNAMVNKIISDQTVVLVSHSMAQIKNLCSRVLWLHAGKVKMIGTDDVVREYLQSIDKR